MERPFEIVQSPYFLPGDSERGGARSSHFSLGFFVAMPGEASLMARFLASKKIKKIAKTGSFLRLFGSGLRSLFLKVCGPRLACRPSPEG